MKAAKNLIYVIVFVINFSSAALLAVLPGELIGKSKEETIVYLLEHYVKNCGSDQHTALIQILLVCPDAYRYELASRINSEFAELNRRRATVHGEH